MGTLNEDLHALLWGEVTGLEFPSQAGAHTTMWGIPNSNATGAIHILLNVQEMLVYGFHLLTCKSLQNGNVSGFLWHISVESLSSVRYHLWFNM
jgi:hypothetical protein